MIHSQSSTETGNGSASSQAREDRSPYIRVALGLLFLLALYLRLLNVDFGLPFFFHPDEVRAVGETQHFLSGHAELHHYNHPPLIKNLAYLGLKLFLFVSGADLRLSAQTVTLALRLVSVFSGVAAVAILYLLALRFVDRWAAFLAALLYAILPLTVMSSKYGVPDMLLGFLFVFSLWISIKLLEGPTVILYGATGLILALAVGAKYTGCFLALPALLAHLLATRRTDLDGPPVPVTRFLVAFLLGSAFGFFASFPLFLFELSNMGKGFWNEVQHLLFYGHGGFKVSGKDMFFLYHFRHSILPATGPVLLAFILAGLLTMVIRRRPGDLVILAAVVPYYLVVEWAYLIPPAPERYILSLVGPYLLALTIIVRRILDSVSLQWLRILGGIFLAIILCAWPMAKTVGILSAMIPDTRQVMKTWMEQNLKQGSTVWIENLSLTYYPDVRGESFHYLFFKPDVLSTPLPEKHGSYLLSSSLAYERYFAYPDQRPEATVFYRGLFRKGTLLHEVSAEKHRYLFHNPTLRLYRIP